MPSLFPLGITRKFILFFILTAILPILVISGLLLNTVNQKMDERITAQLHYGLHVAQELYEQDTRKLEILSTGTVFLSSNERYQHYLRTGQGELLRDVLQRFQDTKSLDMAALMNPEGQWVATTVDAEDVDKESFKAMIHKALAQKRAVLGTERFIIRPEGKMTLMTISVSPVFAINNPQEIIGVVMYGQQFGKKSTLQHLPTIIPGLESRLFIRQGDTSQSVFSTVQPERGMILPAKVQQQMLMTQINPEQTLNATLRDTQSGEPRGSIYNTFGSQEHTFDELIDGRAYKSKASAINNALERPIGYLVVSSSKADLQELVQKNFLYMGLYLLLGLCVITLTGTWFKRTVLDPIVALSNASKQVATGNLDVRIHQLPRQKELAETVHRFNHMVSKLQESEQLRTNFVSTLTHDLRTPLVAQKRALELFELHKHELTPKLSTFAEGLLKSNNNLLDMVNMLLETYQYEAGRIILNPEEMDLHELVRDCFSSLYPIASGKQIQLINKVPEDFPLIWADASQLSRVLNNLVGNALENIPHHCRIEVRAQENKQTITIQVEDNGKGIPEDRLPHLFERYYVADRTHQKIGSGLGLYICKMIIELHGGTIGVSSHSSAGTCFTITLPQSVDQET